MSETTTQESTSATESEHSPRHGKWTCSTDEEVWNGHEELDTEAEALDYAKFVFAPEMGLEDGQIFYVGQIDEITQATLAEAGADATRVLETMEIYLYDNVGETGEDALEATNAQVEDLDARLKATILQWMKEHDIRPRCYSICKTTSHVFHQCDVVDETQGGPSSTARCTSHLGHQDDHEFP